MMFIFMKQNITLTLSIGLLTFNLFISKQKSMAYRKYL